MGKTISRNQWGQTEYQIENCKHGVIRLTCTALQCRMDSMERLNDDRTCGRCGSADVAFADKLGRNVLFVCHGCKATNRIDSSKVRAI